MNQLDFNYHVKSGFTISVDLNPDLKLSAKEERMYMKSHLKQHSGLPLTSEEEELLSDLVTRSSPQLVIVGKDQEIRIPVSNEEIAMFHSFMSSATNFMFQKFQSEHDSHVHVDTKHLNQADLNEIQKEVDDEITIAEEARLAKQAEMNAKFPKVDEPANKEVVVESKK